jgi:uncharacterized membrane protein
MMDNYFVLKFIHIICAVIVAGTGMGIAFFQLMVFRSGNVSAIAVTTRQVVLADWIFTTPAVTGQLITGIWLMQQLHYSFTSMWFITVMALFIFVGVCWVPVVCIQYRLKTLAAISSQTGILHERFAYWMKWWIGLGVCAFSAIVIIFWLMVFKPLPVI